MNEFFNNDAVRRFEEMVDNGEELFFDSEEYEDIISYYLEMGDYQYAELAVGYAEKLYPGSLEIQVRKLELLLERNQNAEAKVLLKELSDRAEDNLDYIICCAKYFSNMGNPRKAIAYCELALEKQEDEDFIHNFIADEYRSLDDPFNAIKHYKKALMYEPDDAYSLESIMVCYGELKKSDEALVFINEYLDKRPYNDCGWYEYAMFQFGQKKYTEAIRGFDYILAIGAESVSVYTNKAACYEALEEWQKAIDCYREAADLEETRSYTYYRIGLCYRQLKQPLAALTAFQQALKEDPQFFLAMSELSDIHEGLGNMKEALHYAKETIALNSANTEYQKRLAFLLIDAGQFEESLEPLKTLVEKEPGRFYNWYAYSEVLMLIGEYPDAKEVLTGAVQIHPRAELYYQLSNCHFNLGEQQEGRDTLAKAVELDPGIIGDMQMKYPSIDDEVKKERSKTK
ncbi:MAG: tetratricopeptide repeat protein [Chryseobacterium sp.]|nr:MAG: tetratricopeptide repeat protein [Chryseobacterium sp.]